MRGGLGAFAAHFPRRLPVFHPMARVLELTPTAKAATVVAALVPVVVLLAWSGAAGAVGPQTCRQHLVVPAYFSPGPAWKALLSHQAGKLVIIVNPSSGPGPAVDPTYRTWVGRARQDGATLLGYVDTAYTGVPISLAEKEVRRYRSWYGVTNIFFDDVTSDTANVGYYRTLSDYVRSQSPGAEVMLNPGDYPAQRYAGLGDQLVVAEYGFRQFLATPPPAFLGHYPSSEFVAIISGVPRADLSRTLALARKRNMAGAYVTDVPTTARDLYEQLPGYWSQEVTAVAGRC